MINQYYYNGQLKKIITAFSYTFSGLQVKTGIGECGVQTVNVPIRYGSSDRVVSAIGASNTATPHSLPIMSCYMRGIQMAPDRIHGLGGKDGRTFIKQGDVFPDDVKVVNRIMPVPYNLDMEIGMFASNTEQLYQMMEQVLLLFDYDLQLQINDAPMDWANITRIKLTGINNEENFPMAVDKRMIIWTLNFEVEIWLSLPYEFRNNLIKKIKLRMGNMNDMRLDEINEDGELTPFTEENIFFEDTITPED